MTAPFEEVLVIIDREPELERILKLAARTLNTPFAIVAVLGDGTTHLTGTESARDLSLPALGELIGSALAAHTPFLAADASSDPFLMSNPLVVAKPCIRFAAGVPVPAADCSTSSMLIVLDTVVRRSAVFDHEGMHEFAELVASHLDGRQQIAFAAAERARTDAHVRFLGRVLDHIDEPVISLDRDGRVVYFNEPAAGLCGIDSGEAIGLHVNDILTVEWTDAEERRQSKRALAVGGVWRGRNRVQLHRIDASIVVEFAISVVYNQAGSRRGFLGILRDMTERDNFEEVLRQSNQELRALVDSAPAAIIGLDTAGRVTRWNRAAERIFGWRADEVHGDVLPTIPLIDVDFQTIRSKVLAGESFSGRETRWRRKDGGKIDVSLSAAPLRDAAGRIDGMMTILDDITEQKRAVEALWQAEQNYRSIFENAFEGIFQSTPDGRYVKANVALARMYGYDSPADLMRGLTNIRHQLYVDPVRRADFIKLMKATDIISEFEAQVYRKDGSIIWISESARAVRDASGNLLCYEGMVVDITGRKALEADQQRKLAEAIERADRDPLTQLFNHRCFHKRLQQETERTDQENSVAVALIDLDNFKFFNDVYGHAVGDDVLRQVASALGRCCRSQDVLARFGGDEFALLMPGADGALAAETASRIHRCLDGMGYRPPGYNAVIPFSLSIGIAVLPDDGVTRFEIIEVADSRLRHMKNGLNDDGFADRLRASLRASVDGFSMLDALVKAVDTKDRYTRRHSEDVMSYSMEIARELRLAPGEMRAAEVAGLLHDVGKIGVPDSILRKPGKLDETDMQAIRQHPMMGAIIVGAVPGFEDALDAVRHHHERWDGGGYPFGLSGPEIPLLARVMAVADAYSAMTTDRPYRKGMHPESALSVLEEGSGTQWDPDCVSAFIRSRHASGKSVISL